MNVKNNNIRVRFAPSPTGNLHIGSARTALFNYLFAKKMGGQFVLRIDDTDLARNKNDSLQMVIDDLLYLGLNWDSGPDPTDTSKNMGNDGPYKSSDRIQIYLDYAQMLITMGKAYSDDGCIRFKVDKSKKFKFSDILRGAIDFSSTHIDDFVIIRSNNLPTYNFACVIDDHLMKISHVIRGDDHINNTFPQLMIYDAFNWSVPKFGHISTILNSDKKKLSKRDGASSISDFKKAGFTKDCLINFISLLGASQPSGGDIFNLDYAIKNFSLKKLVPSPAVFDKDKLRWMNGVYLRSMSDSCLLNDALNYDSTLNKFSSDILIKGISLFKPTVHTLNDISNSFKMIDPSYDPDLDKDSIFFINGCNDFSKIYDFWINYLITNNRLVNVDDFVNNMKSLNITAKDCFWVIRFLTIGSTHGPDVRKLVSLLDKSILIKRAKRINKIINN